MATFQLSGSVINALTKAGIPALRVEAWVQAGKTSKKLATTTTGAEGNFALKFDMQVSPQNPNPLGVFKVFSGATLLLTTPEQPIKLWTAEAPPITIEVDQPVPSDQGWKLSLTLRFSDGRPAADVQLLFRYPLSPADTWTSGPLQADAEGKLAFQIPLPPGVTFDPDRASFAFSQFDKPLRIVKMSPPEHVQGATLLTIELAPEKIPFPPEQDLNKWFVRGRLTTPYGEPVAAAVSAAAISLAGETQLGQVQTGETGRYEIVYEWADDCLPDIQVTAHANDKPIAQSPIRFAAGKAVRIDLVAGDEPVIGPTEFQTVDGRVRTCGDFDVGGIAAKQFDYLLGKTRLAGEKLTAYLTARKLESMSEVPAAVFYGLFRAKMPATLQGLVLQPSGVLQGALNSAIQRNIIDRRYGNAFGSLQAALRQMAVAGSLSAGQQLDDAGVSDLLTMAEVPAADQQSLVGLYLQHGGDDASFWEAVGQDAQLAQYANRTKTTLQVGALASYHSPTVQAFQTKLGPSGTVKDLASWQDGDWQAFAQSLQAAPDTVPGETPAEKIQTYVAGMSRTIKRAFAPAYTTANILRSATFADPILHEFLGAVPDFDYGSSSIPAVLDKTPFTGEPRQVLEQTLGSLQRLYRVAPLEQKFPVMETLYADGVASAIAIASQGSALFIHTYADALGGPDIAAYVYNKAATVTAVATQVLAGYHDLFNTDLFGIGGGVPVSQPDRSGDLAIPSYDDLFGSQSFCECEHCSSVYGPAAYLVDLLEFLRQSGVTTRLGGEEFVQISKDGEMVDKTGLDVLFQRRPDLGDIRLDCRNTNTVLPYIDLVNEVFERAVVGETDSALYQTNLTEQELRANPEHIVGRAYDILAETTYPLTLPFRFWDVEAGHYLDHLGEPRWKLMERLVTLPDAGPAAFDQVSLVYLGLGIIDVDILSGAPAYTGTLAAVGKLWGFTIANWRTVLARAPEFLERSGLAYDELLQLLQAPYVQAAGLFGVDFGGAESACDLDGAVLRYIVNGEFDDAQTLAKDTWDRLQRFVRLLRKTGWSIWELGRVLAVLAQPQLTAQTLVQVSTLKRLADGLALDVLEVLSWWANLDTALDATDPDYRSFYETVFLNLAVLNPPDPALLLNEDRTGLVVGALISGHFSSIAAALQVTQADASVIAGSLLDSTGAVDDALTLENLSRMHRVASLCRALGIGIGEYLLLARLIGADPWDANRPQAAVEFVDTVRFQQASSFSPAELGYLLLHDGPSVLAVQMPATAVADLLTSIQAAVRGVWVRYAASSSTPVGDQLNARLGEYFDQATSDQVLALVGQTSPRSPEDQLYLQETLVFLPPAGLENAIDQTRPVPARYRDLLALLNRYGRTTGSINVVAQMIADAFTLDLAVAQLLLTEVVARSGHPDEYIVNALLEPLFIDSGKERLAAAVSAEFMQDAFNIVEGASTMSEDEIKAFIELHFDFLDPEEAITNLVGPDALTDVLERYQYVTAPLDAAQYYMDEDVFPEQFAAVYAIQKSALVVGKFRIDETELPILHEHAASLGVLKIEGYPFGEEVDNFPGFKAWRNLAELVSLRSVFVAPDSDLFAQLEKALVPALVDVLSPNAEVDAMIAGVGWQEKERRLLVWLYELASAAGWSFGEVAFVASPALLGVSELSDLHGVAALVYLTEATALAVRLGTTAAQLKAWSALDLAQVDAANAKQTARGRYTLEQWYAVAPSLRDTLRERQRDALTAYMLHAGGFGDTTELYNHYLFDAEMSACMLTSRLKLALSSVQLFVQRCLLNLEDEFVAITAAEEWEWRKNYRVWEANRKVFLYPENYIKPELRITRSEAFDEAQSILLQNEVTNEVGEQSLLRYLEALDEVSNLDVAGSYHEFGQADDGTAINRLHVVGRTRGVPHKYFYRVRDGLAWSPWEGLDADIDAAQVLPVVVNRRLYVCWPVFFEKQTTGVDVLSNSTIKEAKDAKIAEEVDHDEYLDYVLNFVVGDDMGMFSGFTMSDYSTSSLEEAVAEYYGVDIEDADEYIDGIIEVMVTLGAQTEEEYLDSARAIFDGVFEETISYFEIKLSVSEYKNGNWMPARTSEHFIESEKKNTALALIEEQQPLPATTGDFHFYTTLEDDVVTVECVQTLRYTDETIRDYVEGRFEYNVLSKEILAVNTIDDLKAPAIIRPTGADLVDNAFVESDGPVLEIPVVGGFNTSYVALLEKTPGTFKAPIQHQYEQFAADDAFFFGDDKRWFIVSQDRGLATQTTHSGTDDILLDDYLTRDAPGIGAYDVFIQDYAGGFNFRLGAAPAEPSGNGGPPRAPGISLRTAAQGGGWLDTNVAEYYSLGAAYRFATFYHPLVGDLIKKVNGEGATAALTRAMQRTSDTFFIAAYQPTDEVVDDYPVRNFSFSDLDANGFYNYEFFFHLPLLIATRLSKNQQFADAQRWFHTIFDPTARTGPKGAQRFWQFKPFFDMYENTAGHPFESIYDQLAALAADDSGAGAATADAATLALKRQTEAQIAAWRANPFDPHAIAALRPVAYMKTVVMAYLDNLIAWGDYLFEQFTHESINEATLYYILAYQILGDRPVALPELNVVARSYNELGELDDFSNAVAQLENVINLPQAPDPASTTVPPLYFCIPNNPTLLQYWDTVADRLFKIRHCMTIEGVVQQLPLFEPPINPALLVAARAGGVSISAALASLATPAPHYRFAFLMQKAVEYCQVVKGLGNQLLAAYEKRDAEALGLLRARYEESLLKASTELKNLQVDEARENLAGLERSKLLVDERIEYYSNLEKRSEKEKAAVKSLDAAELKRLKASDKEMTAARLNLLPNVSVGVSASVSFGGGNLGASFSADAAKARGESEWNTYKASKLNTDASYDRRSDDWRLQERLARKELKQVEKQIIAAQIRLALAEKERDNHAIQLEQSREVKDFLTGKFSNEELYVWMISQTSAIYFQSYKLAYDLAKRCEKAYQRETGESGSAYIAYGYFDSMKKGLLAGDRLHHDLQRMEFDFLNNNRREYELTKHVSLAALDPVALLNLVTAGACAFAIPEALYDFDYPGHYFRRIKSVSMTVPSVTGPYTVVPCRLTLVSSRTRTDPSAAGTYVFSPEGEDGRFQVETGAGQSITSSSGREDAGLFAADHRDERYLPFEGMGAISDWSLKLTSVAPTFDWLKISDVVLHVQYTARDGGDPLRAAAIGALTAALAGSPPDDAPLPGIPLRSSFTARYTFPSEWSAFLHPAQGATETELKIDIAENRFPYVARNAGLSIRELELVALVKNVAGHPLTNVFITPPDEPPSTTPLSFISSDSLYGGQPSATVSYESSSDKPGTGLWTVTLPIDNLEDLSYLDDLVIVITYDITIPVRT